MEPIGLKIKQRLKENGKTVVWFSRQLGCSRTNAYKIFERNSIDTEDLFHISLLLGFDFFKAYSEEVGRHLKKHKG